MMKGYITTRGLSYKLPRIPVECRHLQINSEQEDLTNYKPTSMEISYRLPLPDSRTYGVNVDMCLPEVYFTPHVQDFGCFPQDTELFGFDKKFVLKYKLRI
ncbi:hypothetical protein EIN_079470 [Entamoeba invadens IP1]|uniref:hypothetical protein n=1 Tax=Entamoeba invadens IP1 TaxID=370355 RepID=UPI0002C3D298|nr:hypothetical protein EIN_079470 [Entamoeba invadens IP1]ELP85025.1 hypothetical protein EIN_079470 [Entamoeba invadens IP1]|eukprot:XP_004184371.1 hypothetical protein EIN_079470 [Entamoeba invadens IP1]